VTTTYQRKLRPSIRGLRVCAMLARVVASVILLTTTVASIADTPLEPNEYVVFHHHDALGNTVVTTGANGEVLWFEQTEPYGKTLGRRNVRGGGLAVDPFHEEEGRSRPGYTGHVRDGASGLTYMQARHYSPDLGRFLSNDPIGVDLGNPQSFNRYAYANNNPYRYVDPDGRWAIFAVPTTYTSIKGLLISAGIVGTAAVISNEVVQPQIDRMHSESDDGDSGDTDSTGLPDDPDDLLDRGYEETSHSDAAANGHRTFVNPETGDEVRHDRGEPGKSGHRGQDHYHRPNPDLITQIVQRVESTV